VNRNVVQIGRVVTFDAASGLGTVETHGGGDHYAFHCVEITDGSRQIDVGTIVAFTIILKLGALEAACVTTAGG
jgi:cold shock CspA family protein